MLKNSEIISAILQVSLGLQYLHDSLIVHRDVKTSNILVFSVNSNNVLYKLGDFGISRDLKRADTKTVKKTMTF